MAHAFFPDAVPLFRPSQNRIRQDTQFQIKVHKKINMSTQLHVILHTDFQDILVLWSVGALQYYNYSTNGSTSPENYGYHLVRIILAGFS
jgi:hypothetical protein